jgi:hypothetical protein
MRGGEREAPFVIGWGFFYIPCFEKVISEFLKIRHDLGRHAWRISGKVSDFIQHSNYSSE